MKQYSPGKLQTGKICPNPTDTPLRGTPNNETSDDERRVQRANNRVPNGGYLREGTPSEALAPQGQRRSPIGLGGSPRKLPRSASH